MYVSIFSTHFIQNNFYCREILRDIVKYVLTSLCKMPFILVRLSKNSQISIFIKILVLEVLLFHADGRTDMTKVVVAFGKFSDALRKRSHQNLFLTWAISLINCWKF
jgi:hypothetical protein